MMKCKICSFSRVVCTLKGVGRIEEDEEEEDRYGRVSMRLKGGKDACKGKFERKQVNDANSRRCNGIDCQREQAGERDRASQSLEVMKMVLAASPYSSTET